MDEFHLVFIMCFYLCLASCARSQLNTRRDACEVKSTACRNDYLIQLATVNAHQNRYYDTDLPLLIKVRLLLIKMRRLFCVAPSPDPSFFSSCWFP